MIELELDVEPEELTEHAQKQDLTEHAQNQDLTEHAQNQDLTEHAQNQDNLTEHAQNSAEHSVNPTEHAQNVTCDTEPEEGTFEHVENMDKLHSCLDCNMAFATHTFLVKHRRSQRHLRQVSRGQNQSHLQQTKDEGSDQPSQSSQELQRGMGSNQFTHSGQQPLKRAGTDGVKQVYLCSICGKSYPRSVAIVFSS